MAPKGSAQEVGVCASEVVEEEDKSLYNLHLRAIKGNIAAFPGESGATGNGGDGRAARNRSNFATKARSCRMDSIEKAIENSCRFFASTQFPDGYWWSELESNTTITSEYIMFFHLLGVVDPRRERSMVKYLLHEQLEDGSWGLYYGDEGELSTTVEAYFALKLAGEDPGSEPMRKARDFILRGGGVEASRVFTKIWLALFGQYDWSRIPSMPVEMVLLPDAFPFNIYEFSSWARGTVVPLSVVMDLKPVVNLPPEKSVSELYVPPDHPFHRRPAPPSPVHKFFFLLDRLVKVAERLPVRFLRKRALKFAEKWVLDHQEETGDWGGIQPAMVYGVLAMFYLGYPVDHPVIARGVKALEEFCIEDHRGLCLQSCISPVWDTALTLMGLLDAGVDPRHPMADKASRWLVDRQILQGGDWQVKNDGEPGGWAFEFVNNFYPDVDDSAVILMVLGRLDREQHPGLEACKKRGLQWCVSMQSTCGGWAAFDRDNTLTLLNRIPFGDHEAMVDYPTEDITGRLLDLMGSYGYDNSHPRVRRGLGFLKDLQEPDGCWWGRWGVNYIYGTWSVLRGLVAVGEDPEQPYIRKAAQWLKDCQNPDGGWGETCESYERPELRGQGASTPSQTAWALMGLMAAGEARSLQVARGVQYLLSTQQEDGSWKEVHFTGTGFPKNFYIRYDNYRNCFPLMALGQYRRLIGEA